MHQWTKRRVTLQAGYGQSKVGSEDAESSGGAIRSADWARGLMSASQTLEPQHDSHCGEPVSMVRTVKMELLRALVSECLSAAAEEIFVIVERTIVEYENEMSSSTWVVDSNRRLLDVAKSHGEDVTSQCGQQQPAARVGWEEPGNATPEPTEDRPDTNNTGPDSSPASENDPEILIDIEDDDVKQECDTGTPLKIPEVKKPFECPVCLSSFSSKKTMVLHIKKHPEDNLLLYRCQFCDRCFCHKSEFIVHNRTHKGAKPYKWPDCEKSFDERDSLLIHRQKHAEEKPCQRFSATVEAETHLRSVTLANRIEKEMDCRQDESGNKTFPLTITPNDTSEFHQESLQPLCLYQIQTVADIDNDPSAAVPVDHIKTKPAGADSGVSDGTTDDQLLLSVYPSEQGESKTEPKRLNVENVLQRRPSGKPAELIVQFQAGMAQKPFKCPCCAKCFSLTKTLIRHLRIHTEDKPYQCQFCGRSGLTSVRSQTWSITRGYTQERDHTSAKNVTNHSRRKATWWFT